jgi:hypothetical protein
MDATLATMLPAALSPDAPPHALHQAWITFLRAMEGHYDAPVRQTPAELRTAAAWAACVGLQPPALPAPHREAVLVG